MQTRELAIEFDPMGVAARVMELEDAVFLYSGKRAYGLGRYSILAAQPDRTLRYRNGVATLRSGGEVARRRADLFTTLEEAALRCGRAGELPFHEGWLGYFSYDAGRYLERVAVAGKETANDDGRFGWYSSAIVFDHEDERTYVSWGKGASDEKLDTLQAVATGGEAPRFGAFEVEGGVHSNFTAEEYKNAVRRVRDYIRDGEVYQVNLSQRYAAGCRGHAFDLFRRLAEASPAPYSAFLNYEDEQIVSSSPERFLYLRDGLLRTRPIKGTRPTGATLEETERNELELEASEKDRSELLMILDLERNDLGRVCRPGSVDVERLFALERYSTVIHQTADVIGELEPGFSAVDCVKAMFPGGSITGAPKIRAMQVIEELERGDRGVYTGAIGYLDASGGADFNIAIRTIRVAEGELTFQVGGGIVWDSDPDSEYEETLLKAKAMMQAMGGCYV